MEQTQFIDLMRGNAQRIRLFATGISTEQARWKPESDFWSILEVINHLHSEETEDFRTRLDLLLHHPDQEWPPIDPQGWVAERAFNQRELKPSLEAFLAERKASLRWLDSLGQVDWGMVHVSSHGSMRAGDLFASWVTHDQLHLRQLVELHRAYTALRAAPYEVDYAGPW